MSWGRLRTAGLLIVLVLGFALPAVSAPADPPPAAPATQTDTTTAPAPPTAPAAPAPAPAPRPKPAVAAKLRVYLPDLFFVHGDPLTVPRRSFHVGGVVRPYVAGQWVTVKLIDGRRVLKSRRLRLKPSHDHRFGAFRYHISSPRTGILTVVVSHAATPQMKAFRARRRFKSLDPNAGFGATGRFVQLIQQRLAALHFYVTQTGVYDQGTGLAIDAYHRLLHWGTSQSLDGRTVSFLLDGFGDFKVRFPNHGRHAEGDLGLQLLALADGGKVDMIFPISSGKPSTPTILGDFQVDDREPGYNAEGMYYSDFFYNGYAIHGYDPAPDYPASHGCMRLPIVDAITVFDWLSYGDWVDTYY
jgi:hypothetical protein